MLGLFLLVITFGAITSALCCGVVTWALGRRAPMSPKRSFAWGVVLGPFGVVPVLRERRALERAVPPNVPDRVW
jgi:hypothetical protein